MKKNCKTVLVNGKEGPGSIGPIVISKVGAWVESVLPLYETQEVKKVRPKGFFKNLWDTFKNPGEFEYKRVQVGFRCCFGVGSKEWRVDGTDKKELEKFRKAFIKAID